MVFNLNDAVDFYQTPNKELIQAGSNYEFQIQHFKDELKKMEDYKDEILVKIPFSEYMEEIEYLESAIQNFSNIVSIISLSGLPEEDAFKFSVSTSTTH